MDLSLAATKYKRLLALVMSIFVGIATGTPYLYGIYSPQLIKKVGLTISDSATISFSVSIGTGGGGLLGGIIIDHYGPRFSIFLGAIFLSLGYFGLYRIFMTSFDNLLLICCSAALMGFGSITGYFAALKAAQANFPNHRGTAGVFPVSSYGLSATLFSVIAASSFPNNTGGLLKFLAIFCGLVTLVGSFFVTIYIHDNDHDHENIGVEENTSAIEEESTIGINQSSSLLQPENNSSNNYDSANTSSKSKPIKINNPNPHIHDNTSNQSSLAGSFSFWGIGQRTPRSSVSSLSSEFMPPAKSSREQNMSTSQSQSQTLNLADKLDRDTFSRPVITSRNNSFSSLRNMPRTSSMNSMNNFFSNNNSVNNSTNNSPNVSQAPSVNMKTKTKKKPLQIIKKLLLDKKFMIHYLLVSLIAGSGQTYIYSIGFIAAAQVNYGGSPSNDFTELSAKIQALQVAIISIASFSGRVLSGIISDLIYKKFHIQRLWIMTVTILILALGQFLTMNNNGNIHLVSVTSVMVGGSYGLAFGVYPAIVADFFGTRTFSTTWGLICTGPLIVLFGLNKHFGIVYDSHTNPETGICYKGSECYKGAIENCFLICILTLLVSFLLIYIHRKQR